MTDHWQCPFCEANKSDNRRTGCGEWQTIESAPRDGTEIIGVYYSDWPTVYGPWTIAWNGKKWRSSWDSCEVLEYMGDFNTDYKEPDCQPTHWMPLPPPPVKQPPE